MLKLYQVLPDSDAARHRQLRVIDESGEDYLYFEELFIAGGFSRLRRNGARAGSDISALNLPIKIEKFDIAKALRRPVARLSLINALITLLALYPSQTNHHNTR